MATVLMKFIEDEWTGRAWDFTNPQEQAQLWGLLRRRPAKLLMASPPCATFSSGQRVRKIDMPTEYEGRGPDVTEGGGEGLHVTGEEQQLVHL